MGRRGKTREGLTSGLYSGLPTIALRKRIRKRIGKRTAGVYASAQGDMDVEI